MCEDADTAVHMMSKDHPDYDPDTIDRKVETIRKSTSCAKFRSVNPELCEGCPHFDKIKGPKELGKVVKESSEDFVIVETEEGVVEQIDIPKYPFPFYRGDGGGVWRKPPKDDAEAEPRMVYANDFYVVKRMHDPGEGDSALMRLHLPQDGLREFTVAMSKVTQKDELRKILSANGVYSYGKRFDMLMEYVLASAENLQDRQKAEIMRQQFGWVDGNSRFVLGDQEMTVDGNIYSPPSKATGKLAKFIGPVGSLDKWKDVWSLYGEPGMEAQAFAALSAFGSPLLKFLNQTGAVINPNKYRGYRRAPWFERYATKGRLTPDQHAAASRLFQAYEGFPARDPLAAIGSMVDKSNWTNDPLAVKVDQRREFYQMWHSIPTQSRPIVQHVILYDIPIRSVAGCTNSDREERQMQRLREGLNAIP
jgi:hypothetical protein